MAWFNRKDKVIDLGEHYRKKQELLERVKNSESPNSSAVQETKPQGTAQSSFFPSFLSDLSKAKPHQSQNNEDEYLDIGSNSVEEKRKKLAKRLMDMTTKIEELSNQIYRLQQRIEVLEKKSGVSH